MERRSKNWRDASNVYSFYFTSFLEDMGEKDLSFEFKKWVGVKEVFIVKNRNWSVRRYSFVRFKGADDVRKLERQLDNLILGRLKLHANLPKHGREWKLMEKTNKINTKGWSEAGR